MKITHPFKKRLYTYLQNCLHICLHTRWRKSILFFLCLACLSLILSIHSSSLALIPSPSHSSDISQSQQTPEATLQEGLRLYAAGRYAEAITRWQSSLSQMNLSQMEPLQQSLRLSYLALAYQKLGDWQQAERSIAESLEQLQTGSSHPRLLAQVLNTQGQIQLGMGQPEAALKSWRQAETYYIAAEHWQGQIGSQINQAQALQTLGLYRRAQSLLEAVNTTLQTQPDSALKALGLKSLGTVWQVTGQLTASQQALQQSLSIAEQLNLRPQISEIQFSLANTLRSLQSNEAALQLYQQSANMALTLEGKLQAQLNQLSLLLDTQQLSSALALAEQLQPQISTLSPSRTGVYLQVNFATQGMKLSGAVEQREAYVLAAAHVLAQAIQQSQDLSDPRAESYAVGQLAHLYEQTQQWEIAQSLSQRALLLAQSVNADDIAYRWQWQIGRMLKRNDLAAAKDAYTEALKTLSLIRRDLLSTQPEFQVSFRGDVEPLYRELVDLLVRTNATPTDLNLAREAIESLRLAELENFFRSACLEPAQQIDQVDRTAAIFYPILLPDQLLVILSLPGQPLRYHTTPVLQSEVEAVIASFRRSLILPYTANRDIQNFAYQLYTWMIQPVAAALTKSQIETLVFVQDGALQSIPMAALYDGERYLIETYSIASTPGLRLFGSKPLDQVPLNAVTAGLTEARHSFESLEFVEVELAQIRSKIPSEVLLDQDFTSTTLSSKLDASSAPILHIATHGQFSSEADQTFILAWDQPITVGHFSQLLRTREQQPNTLELLVLSACETAIGDKRAALGLAGIAVQSGARSTLASLWLIDDESTPVLMTQFYQELKTGRNKATALRQAQLKLLQGEYRHPRFWAAFVLLGNWQ